MQDNGILPLSLLEAATSLEVSPFAAKAIRATGLSSIRELADYVFHQPEECRAMGQAHVEEIRSKIEQLVGRPPYIKTNHLNLPSLLRLFLQTLDPQDRSFFLVYANLLSLVSVNSSLLKEAQLALSRNNKNERFDKIVDSLKSKGFNERTSIEQSLYTGIVQPWIRSLGGIIHQEELLAFAYSRSSLQSYDIFDQTVRILGLLMNESFLFESFLIRVGMGIYAETEELKQIGLKLLENSDSLRSNGYQNAANLAFVLAKTLPLRKSRIQNLLFWTYRTKDQGYKRST